MKLNSSKEKKKYKSLSNYKGKIIIDKYKASQTIKPFKLLSNLRQGFLSLPSTNDDYIIQNQLHYIVKLSQILRVLSLQTVQNKHIITQQMVFASIEPHSQLRQLITIFNNLTEHKQVVIAILISIYRRVLDYIVGVVIDKKRSKHQVNELEKSRLFLLYLSKDVFQSIQFLLEFECGLNGFKINQYIPQQSSIESTTNLLNQQYQWIQQNLSKIIFLQQTKLILITKPFQSVTQIVDRANTNNKASLLVVLTSIRQFSSLVLKYLPVIMKII